MSLETKNLSVLAEPLYPLPITGDFILLSEIKAIVAYDEEHRDGMNSDIRVIVSIDRTSHTIKCENLDQAKAIRDKIGMARNAAVNSVDGSE